MVHPTMPSIAVYYVFFQQQNAFTRFLRGILPPFYILIIA